MLNLSEHYHLRKHYLKSETVPTQSVIKERMSPLLAAVYFKSMRPQLKVLAGLEPPMKGGGSTWYAPPHTLLKGRTVLKPVKKECLANLNVLGISAVGMKLYEKELHRKEDKKKRMLALHDEHWRQHIEACTSKLFEKYSKEAKQYITTKLEHGLTQFKDLFITSMTRVEQLLTETSLEEIELKREEAHHKMTERFKYLVKQQSIKLRDKYDMLLEEEKGRLKNKFIEELETHRAETSAKIHDVKINKQFTVEAIRKYLICQRLACQVYVTLKERDEGRKEMEQSRHRYQKQLRTAKEEIALQDFEIHIYQEKEKKQQECIVMWQKKVQKLVKYLQIFMMYCLHNLPEHADFFINLEKLVLLHLSRSLDNPSAESIFEYEREQYTGPVPRPHPFYLLCDKGNKPVIDQDLCPKHCTSSATQLPVVIINKRFIYSACDNFEQFSEKLTQFAYRKGDDDLHLEDHHIYEYDVPVKYTSSQQLLELKLESSLLQILQEELPNMQLPNVMCTVCNMSQCLCGIVPLTAPPSELITLSSIEHVTKHPTVPEVSIATRQLELLHEREPKWESYSKFVETKTCRCTKTVKKNLMEHLPPYMRQTSAFEGPELPNYEMCTIESVKDLVRKAGKTTSSTLVRSAPSMTHDVGTQYQDHEFESLCNCFTLEDLESFVCCYGMSDVYKLIDCSSPLNSTN